jgi:hypothetical protein
LKIFNDLEKVLAWGIKIRFFDHFKELTLAANVDSLRASSSILQIFVVYFLGSSDCAGHRDEAENKPGTFLPLVELS